MELNGDPYLDTAERWFRVPSADLIAWDGTLRQRKSAYMLEWDGELRVETSNRTIALHRWVIVRNRRDVRGVCREVFFTYPDLQKIQVTRLKRDDDVQYRREAVGVITRGSVGLHVRFDDIEARQRRQEKHLKIALQKIKTAIEFAAQRDLLTDNTAEELLSRIRQEMAGILARPERLHDLLLLNPIPEAADPS